MATTTTLAVGFLTALRLDLGVEDAEDAGPAIVTVVERLKKELAALSKSCVIAMCSTIRVGKVELATWSCHRSSK